jgi:hypothetical protein
MAVLVNGLCFYTLQRTLPFRYRVLVQVHRKMRADERT